MKSLERQALDHVKRKLENSISETEFSIKLWQEQKERVVSLENTTYCDGHIQAYEESLAKFKDVYVFITDLEKDELI